MATVRFGASWAVAVYRGERPLRVDSSLITADPRMAADGAIRPSVELALLTVRELSKSAAIRGPASSSTFFAPVPVAVEAAGGVAMIVGGVVFSRVLDAAYANLRACASECEAGTLAV